MVVWYGPSSEISASWIDRVGEPIGVFHTVSTKDSGGSDPTVVQLTDGDVAIVWGTWVRRYDRGGKPRDRAPRSLPLRALDAAAASDGQMLLLADDAACTDFDACGTEVGLAVLRIAFDADGAPVEKARAHLAGTSMRPRPYALASAPGTGRAAAVWFGGYPTNAILQPLTATGELDGDPEAIAQTGDHSTTLNDLTTAWIDVAVDGLGAIGVVWSGTQTRTIYGWTAANGLTLVDARTSDRMPRFPRIAGFPDGGFIAAWSVLVDRVDEDAWFDFMNR